MEIDLAKRHEWTRRLNIPGVTIRRMYGKRTEDYELSRCGIVLATRTVMLTRGKPTSELYIFYPCVDALGAPL